MASHTFWFRILNLILPLVCLVSAIALNGQSDLIYLRNDSILIGDIVVENRHDNVRFKFIQKDLKDTVVLDPNFVRQMVISKGEKNLYESFVIEDDRMVFGERIHKTENVSLYRIPASDNYYIHDGDKPIFKVAQDLSTRQNQIRDILDVQPSIINRQRFVLKEKDYINLIDYLSHPKYRYPNNYYGLSVSHFGFRTDELSQSFDAKQSLSSFENFSLSSMVVSAYVDKNLNSKSTILSRLSLGLKITSLNGHGLNENNEVSYSGNPAYFESQIDLRRQFNTAKINPSIGLHISTSTLISNNTRVFQRYSDVSFATIEIFRLSDIKAFFWTPGVFIGAEIPIRNQYFIWVKGFLNFQQDLIGVRNIVPGFSLGLNLI